MHLRPCPPARATALALALSILPVACSGGSGGSTQGSPPVSGAQSRIDLRFPPALLGDGVATVEIVASLRDAAGLPLAGVPLSASAPGDGNLFVPASTVRTDPDGRASIRFASTSAGSRRLVLVAGSGAGIEVVWDDLPPIDFRPPTTKRGRVSESTAGEEAQDFSGQPAISADGGVVAFQSKAANLVAGDTNEKEDVFVRLLASGRVERVSWTPAGAQFNDLCGEPSLSDDGSLVAFTGRERDDDEVFVRDRIGGVTEPVSDAVGRAGRAFAPDISGDGRWIAFVFDDGESRQVYVRDRLSRRVELCSVDDSGRAGSAPSFAPSISRDGRYVAFASEAADLVGDDSNEKIDVFVRDRVAGTTVRASLGSAGGEGNGDSVEPDIAADGRYVVFSSLAEDLVARDDNGKWDVFRRDLATGETLRVSVDAAGAEVDKESWRPRISADGSLVVFSSLADGLVADDRNGKEDVFATDLVRGGVRRVSLARGGTDPNQASTAAALAHDRPAVAFTSHASNLVGRDENDQPDVFSSPAD